VQVFAGNLRDLLLAAPAGARPTMGLDPGYRTGVKVAVVSETGQTAATTTIYPHEPQRRWDEAIAQLARLAREHRVELISIGNGTASRETDRLGAELIRLHPELELTKVVVSEAGASVYSASAFASHELPGLDVCAWAAFTPWRHATPSRGPRATSGGSRSWAKGCRRASRSVALTRYDGFRTAGDERAGSRSP
jgi:transcriptional accessory protein Tex/SPT6